MAKRLFVFSLGERPARFGIVKPESALGCTGCGFGFGSTSGDLFVLSDGGGCRSRGQGDYARPRGKRQLVGGTASK
jgi:hypothetical protein